MHRPSVQLLSQASYYRNLSSKRNFEGANTIRKIRVICYDPDATDSSSDEHDEDTSWLKRRIVQVISLPNSSSEITTSRSVTEVSCKGSDNGERATRVSSVSKNRGVMRRKRRAEIRRPVDGNAEEEAVSAYEVKKIEINALVEADKSQGSSCSENLEEIQMLPTCVVELNELDSLFINDYGEVFDDLTAFNDLPICESDSLDGFLHLPSFDFELWKDEFSWFEEPLNIACCP